MTPCQKCKYEAFCAINEWNLYDPYNKKCPNWLEGVKQWHKFLKEEAKEDKRNWNRLCQY